MKTTLAFILLIVTPCQTFAQQVTGLVKDTVGNPIRQASVTLRKNIDSSIVKIAMSDSSGRYTLNYTAVGTFFLTSSHV